MLHLPIDDLLVVAGEFVNPQLSRSALHRMLKRRQVPTLAELRRQEVDEASERAHKPFKEYGPGFVHVDIKYLPQMPDESHRRYLYVAIDRATRWVFLQVRDSQSAAGAQAFMRQLTDKAPFRIEKLLTDNGKAFTDRFSHGGQRSPSGNHPVDRYCDQQGIEHRLIAPGRPQTNGMGERFNGRISDVLATRRYDSREDLETTLKRYNWLYNHQIPQRALNHQPPIQAMKQRQAERLELFHKKVIDHPAPRIPAPNQKAT